MLAMQTTSHPTKGTSLMLTVLLLLAVSACGGGGDGPAEEGPGGDAAGSELSAEQLEKGIGPIQQVDLGSGIEADLAAQGAEIFAMKCSACHKMEARYVGPPLGDVLAHRTPEYVMNMMLNTAEMLQKHPEAKAMLAQYMTPMPNQSLTQEEARAILEYLRQENDSVTQ